MSDPARAFPSTPSEREQARKRLLEIELALREMGLGTTNGRIGPIIPFERIDWQALFFGLITLAVVILFESWWVIVPAMFFTFLGFLMASWGPVRRVLHRLRIHAWRPRLAEIQVEIGSLRRKILGEYADFDFQIRKLDDALCAAYERKDTGETWPRDQSFSIDLEIHSYQELNLSERLTNFCHHAYIHCQYFGSWKVYVTLKVYNGEHRSADWNYWPAHEVGNGLTIDVERSTLPKFRKLLLR